MRLLIKLGLGAGLIGLGGVGILAAAPDSTPTTISDATAQTAVILTQMREDANHVLRLQGIARKDKDVIKLNCVNDKLVELKPLLNVAEQLANDVRGGTNAAGSFGELSRQADDVRHIRQEADQCIGDQGLQAEASNSSTGPGLPDPGTANPWGSTVIEPPAYASPFK